MTEPTNEEPPGTQPGGELTTDTNDRPEVATEAATEQERASSPKGEGQWGWFSKRALERIAGGETGSVPRNLPVYIALLWCSSNARSSTFPAYVAELSKKSGLSDRATRYAIRDLERAGLIRVQHSHEGRRFGASRFTILSTRRKAGGGAGNAGGVMQEVQEGSCTECKGGTAPEDRVSVPRLKEVGRSGAPQAQPHSSYKKKTAKKPAPSAATRPRSLEAAGRGRQGASPEADSDLRAEMRRMTEDWVARCGGGQ